MIDCTEVAVRLMDYAMDDLGDAARDEVDQHLAACPECARLVDEYRAVSEMVHDAYLTELSPEQQAELDAAVLEAIKHSA